MTAAAAHPPHEGQDLSSPGGIRSALLPEEAPRFDLDYRRALKIAAEELKLDELHDTLKHWRLIAKATAADPGRRRRLLATIDEFERTGEPPAGSVPWPEVKARLGL